MRDASYRPAPEPSTTTPDRGANATNRVTPPGDTVMADGLPLERLYARFDEIARGRAHGDSWAAHQSIIARLASNQLRAASQGWSDLALERVGGTGRLELRGASPDGSGRSLVPDAIPYDALAPSTTSPLPDDAPAGHDGRLGAGPVNVSWRSRMSWLDDGGR